MKFLSTVFLALITIVVIVGCSSNTESDSVLEVEQPVPEIQGPTSAPSASPIGNPPA